MMFRTIDRMLGVAGLAGWLATLSLAAAGDAVSTNPAPEGVVVRLVESFEAGGEGVFLDDVLTVTGAGVVPHVRVAEVPVFGQVQALQRSGLAALLEEVMPSAAGATWEGAEVLQLSLRTRLLEEVELCQMVTDAAQAELGEQDGRLELSLARPWEAVMVPEEGLTVRILDLPRSRLRSYLLVRFELLSGDERVGSWHLTFRASLWKEVPVARSNLERGVRLVDSDISLEEVDALTVRDPLSVDAMGDPNLELSQYVKAGQPVPARAVRVRPVIRRGSVVEGLLNDQMLMITLKVEALEDALPGQTFRVRNLRNRREYLAQARDNRTVVLLL